VFFEGLRHDKKMQYRNYPVLRGRCIYQGLKEFHGKDSSFAILTT